jgi:hypothetical protein
MSVRRSARCRGISLVGIVWLMGLLGIVAINVETAWLNHQLRVRVANGMVRAGSATIVVQTNAMQGRPLDYGWVPADHSVAGEQITISNETGIITVAFAGNIEGEPRNLKLVPISNRRVIMFSDSPIAGGPDLVNMKWLCTSRESGNPFVLPADGFGSLPARFAPARCR